MTSTEWKLIFWIVLGLLALIFWGMATDKSKPGQNSRQRIAEDFVDKLDKGANRD